MLFLLTMISQRKIAPSNPSKIDGAVPAENSDVLKAFAASDDFQLQLCEPQSFSCLICTMGKMAEMDKSTV